MMKYGIAILSALAITLFCFSSEAFSTDGYVGETPSWMDPFADPQPVYKFDWAFGIGSVKQGENGEWYNTPLSTGSIPRVGPHVGQSRGDGTAYANSSQCYWTSYTGAVSGFSVSNDIGDWIDAIGTGKAVIRYSIRDKLGASLDNSDIVELGDDEVEALIKHGYNRPLQDDGVYDTLGISPGQNITALEWNVNFDDANMLYDHVNAINSNYYRSRVWVDKNQDDDTVYMTWGATAELDESGDLLGTARANKFWNGTNNGYYTGDTYYITINGNTGEYLEDPTFDGTSSNWYLPVTIGSTTYNMRMDLPYDGDNYPASSGAVIQWYDDYDLYLTGAGITNPGGYGVSGRYVLERDEFLHTGAGSSRAHHGDVCWEMRTYDPNHNDDGPESPYEWLYDASGDVYEPTDGSGLPGDTEEERAYKLIGCHPYWVDDDSSSETDMEPKPDGDNYIWMNSADDFAGLGALGAVSRGCFVDSWRLAGLMLGQEFWNVNPNYVWSAELGAVAERTWAVDLIDISWADKMPVWTWDSVAGEWVLPDTYNTGDPAIMDRLHLWDWINVYTDTPVAGYDALNNFMKYVFDIDAVVVEDVDGDGEFDIGDDYVLFSVVDDGLYSMYHPWGVIDKHAADVEAFFGGQYFDGDTIFLYDGTSVTTFFDAEAGIFFGQPIDTATGLGTGQTLWSMLNLYDLDALDIGIIPEPSTLLLFSSAILGMAGVLLKRRLWIMKKQLVIIAAIAIFSFLWVSSEAFSTGGYTGEEPDWMKPFADPQPVYKFDWAFGTGSVRQGEDGRWYDISLSESAGKSRGDGTAYTGQGSGYWTSISGQLNGFSLSNPISDWIDAIGSGRAVIRYSIREDYGTTIDNGDVIELSDDEVEAIIKHAHGVADSFGLKGDENITALEWNVDFDDENLVYDHVNSINSTYYRCDMCTSVISMQDDETVYMTFGAEAELDVTGDLVGTVRSGKGWNSGNYAFGRAHHADICYETRTYNPTRNTDGPESPYEWLYDASGDMYVPTDGSGSPTDTEEERAFKLIGAHPFWVDDDTFQECEFYPKPDGDGFIWMNSADDYAGTGALGTVSRGCFVDSWRLAGLMLGQEFWNDDPDYHWDPEDGRIEDETDSAVAGYDELNNFMRYVFDIDALVVEDNGIEGEFEEGDYVLFSVVEDSLYSKYQEWGVSGDVDINAYFGGQYFDGDTIFLYDGTSVTTFFDAEA
ncbi:MAG: PEP-CTERM sorting domain-containing protein, partial [Planctomycetota bacterium]